jgi:hypothetical protein
MALMAAYLEFRLVHGFATRPPCHEDKGATIKELDRHLIGRIHVVVQREPKLMAALFALDNSASDAYITSLFIIY